MFYAGIAGLGVYLFRQRIRRAPQAVLIKLAVDPSTGNSRTKAQISDAILVAIADIQSPPNSEEIRVLSHFLEIEAAAKAYRLEPALIAAMIHVESRGVSNKKTLEQAGFYVYGLMQIRGTTADLVSSPNVGLIGPISDYEILRNDGPSIFYGTAYVRYQMNRYRDKMWKVRWAVAAYNRGTAKYDPKKRRFSNEDYVMFVVDRKLPRYVYLFHQIYDRVGRATFRGLAAFEDRGCYGCQGDD
jgi:soluble lytic murein transglycosylase-like protein